MASQGLTGYAVAKKAGLAPQTIYEIIRTRSSPRIDTADKIQAALGARYPGIDVGDVPESIGPRIKKARIARDLKPAELARKAGVARAKLADWESGDIEPSDEELAKILEVLKMTHGDLLREYDEQYVAERIRKDKTDTDDIRAVLTANPDLGPADIEVIMRIVETKEREVRGKKGEGGKTG